MLLQDYSPLSSFNSAEQADVVFGSKTKSFLSTHYSSITLNGATLDKCLLNHGMRYGLYAAKTGHWTTRQMQKPSFAELCRPSLTGLSPFKSLETALHPIQGITGMTSNDVLAWQTKCPAGMTVLEGQSFLGLRLGGNRLQWARLLRELASTNLNFGLEAVTVLVTQLALQAGLPKGKDLLREAHWAFNDKSYCDALLGQLRRRIDACQSNWREATAVDCYATVLLRCYALTPYISSHKVSHQLLIDVRTMSLAWARALRQEIFNAKDANIAKRRSIDAINAAMLCRRTFAVEAHDHSMGLSDENTTTYLEIAIILKENLPDKIRNMSARLRRQYIQDIKLVYLLEKQICSNIVRNTGIVSTAVNNIWPTPPGTPQCQFTAWRFMSAPAAHWLSASTVPLTPTSVCKEYTSTS